MTPDGIFYSFLHDHYYASDRLDIASPTGWNAGAATQILLYSCSRRATDAATAAADDDDASDAIANAASDSLPSPHNRPISVCYLSNV